MTTAEVLTQLQPIFEDVFDAEGIVLTRETSAEDIEAWDSLSQIRLTAAMEKAFGIKFAYGEIGALRNVGALADAIVQHEKD